MSVNAIDRRSRAATACPAPSFLCAAVLAAIAFAGCASPGGGSANAGTQAPPPMQLHGTAYEAALVVELPKVPPKDRPGLHNVYALSDDIISGSEPHGEEAFAELARMGVRTILSVDGKVPDADLAAEHGMKYVHVPIQYKGITADEKARIAKTFRELDGPFYVHCFHGKHRGPAAAAIGRVVRDAVPREQAIAEMRQWCGTAQSYEGLYQTIAASPLPTAVETRAYAFDFPAAHPIGGVRQAMIEAARADDHLAYLSKREWQVDPEHPDVDALNEATKLASILERMGALDEVASKPADFRGWMTDSVRHSQELRDAIGAWQKGGGAAQGLSEAYQRLANDCKACHMVYRN